MTYRGVLLAGAGMVGLGAAVLLAPLAAQTGTGGTAEYWMTADTTSGMGGMASGGMGGMMGAMLRGGRPNPNAYVHSLRLELGSPRKATGEPTAEHDPPAGLSVGPMLPLVTPRVEPVQEGPVEPWKQGNMERPKGRMLLYWGCGDHAGPGQPFVIDFATLGTTGRMPPEMMPMQVRTETPPSSSRFATYGVWPNEKSHTQVPANGSLVGDHVVKGNYSPEIRFTLAPGQDFLPPVVLTSNAVGPAGSVPLVWNPVSAAKGWLLTSMGSGGNGDFVIWTSSQQRMAMSAFDYLPESEIARLVTQRVLLPGNADRCTVPAEVKAASQQAMLMITAFGGQTNMSYPPRPARPPAGWRPDWVMKLRTKATYSGLLGMSLEQMMGGRGGSMGAEQGEDQSGDQSGEQQPKKKKKKGFGLPGLGGLIPHP